VPLPPILIARNRATRSGNNKRLNIGANMPGLFGCP
jgi:hypothetical protein